MPSVPSTFKGFAASNDKDWYALEPAEYTHKPLNPNDVVIKVECCGVCGSDIHTLGDHWGGKARKDLVVGHEIVGTAVHVGDKVTTVKVGDRVGLGASSGSCMECSRCKSGNEQYCPKSVATYNSVDASSDNYVTQGGYANYAIGQEQFVFQIPEEIPSEAAAPLLCAGLTVYSPIVRTLGTDLKGKTVGVVGIGGLGHLGVKFAAALGAKVIAFSRTTAKKEDALAMGASDLIGTSEGSEWTSKYFDTFDMILNTTTNFSNDAFAPYFSVLKVEGSLVNVAAPPVDQPITFTPAAIIFTGVKLVGSLIGNREEVLQMLDLAAKKKVFPIIEKVPINKENCKKVISRADKSDVKYRFVFTDFDKGFA